MLANVVFEFGTHRFPFGADGESLKCALMKNSKLELQPSSAPRDVPFPMDPSRYTGCDLGRVQTIGFTDPDLLERFGVGYAPKIVAIVGPCLHVDIANQGVLFLSCSVAHRGPLQSARNC